MTARISILTVCTGNICRSPLAAAMLQKGLYSRLQVSVSSAGVFAGTGDPVTPETCELGDGLGIDLRSNRSRFMTEEMVRPADILFAMSRSHRRAIVEAVPRKVGVTFTIREFGRIASTVSDAEFLTAVRPAGSEIEGVAAIAGLIASRRGQVDLLANPEDDDVVDPYRKSVETYAASLAQLQPAVDEAIRALSFAAVSTANGVLSAG